MGKTHGTTQKERRGRKEEREGETEKEEGEGAGRRWVRWPSSHAGDIPVIAVLPKN